MGVMGATSEVAAHAMLQSELGCQHGTGGGQEGPPDQPRAPGQVHLSFFACRKLIAGEAGKIIRAMGLGQPGLPAGGRAKAVGLSQKAFRASVVGKQPELFHRKAMLGREWEAVVWMMNDGYGHRRSGCSGFAASECQPVATDAIPESHIDWISSAVYPHSVSSSLVCSPRCGAPCHGCSGVAENREGARAWRSRPAWG